MCMSERPQAVPLYLCAARQRVLIFPSGISDSLAGGVRGTVRGFPGVFCLLFHEEKQAAGGILILSPQAIPFIPPRRKNGRSGMEA